MENLKNALNQFNKNIIDSAPLSILVIDKNGNIVFVNQFYKSVSSEKNPLSKNIFKTNFFINQGLVDGYKELLEKGTVFEKKNCQSEDKNKYLNIVAVPLKDKDGKISGALSMATDVTETVEAKLKLAKLNVELENKVVQKTRQLEKSVELKARFISEASHELRTPLAVAKLNLELLKKQISNKSALDALSSVDDEINKFSDILSQISFFTAIDEKQIEKVNAEKIELKKIIKDTSERLKILAGEKGVDIILEKCEDNPVVFGDKAKLEKLFSSVIGNSIKYSKNAGWVKISLNTDKKNNAVKIIIKDNGVGMTKKDLPRIFDRFYRSDASKKRGDGGFGLGLSVCKWITDQHNGTICAESILGKGSIFTITLPQNLS